MALIKFNSDSRHFYDCIECVINDSLATIKGIESHPETLEGGFGVFEYDDISCTNPHLVVDLSDYSLLWKNDKDNLVFSNDKRVYRTYFIYNEDGFITDEKTGVDEIVDGVILEDSGIGREHQEFPHINLYDEDGFYLYKVVNGIKVDTTAAEKKAWLAQFTYNIYYHYNDDNFIDSAIVMKNDTPESNYIFVREIISKDGVPIVSDVLFDEDSFYLYKVVNNTITNTTVAEKIVWKQQKVAAKLQKTKEDKITEIANACATAITNGIDVEGHHYSYALTDQNNLYNAMNLAIQTGLEVPYHADGENCRLFTKEELVAIYVAAETNATSEITYNNQMKQYINTLTDINDVNAITHGIPLTGIYLDTYNAMMAQAQEIIRRVIGEN